MGAKRARDEAVERVGQPEDSKRWIDGVLSLVQDLHAGAEFSTDYLWEWLSKPREPRALGAAMSTARKRGLIVPLDKWVQSTRYECHARPLRVWKRV